MCISKRIMWIISKSHHDFFIYIFAIHSSCRHEKRCRMSVRFFCLCQCSRNQQCLQSNLFFCKFLDCFSLLLRLPLHSASPKWRRLTKRRAYLNLNRILLSFSSPILNEPCLPVTEQTALKPKNYSRFCQFEVKKEIRFYIDINLSSHF